MATLTDEELNQLLEETKNQKSAQIQQNRARQNWLVSALAEGAKIAEAVQNSKQALEHRRRAPGYMYAGLDPAIQQSMQQQNLARNELQAQQQASERRAKIQEEQNEIARQAQRMNWESSERDRAQRLKLAQQRLKNDKLERDLRREIAEMNIDASEKEMLLSAMLDRELREDELAQMHENTMAQIGARGEQARELSAQEYQQDLDLLKQQADLRFGGELETPPAGLSLEEIQNLRKDYIDELFRIMEAERDLEGTLNPEVIEYQKTQLTNVLMNLARQQQRISGGSIWDYMPKALLPADLQAESSRKTFTSPEDTKYQLGTVDVQPPPGQVSIGGNR